MMPRRAPSAALLAVLGVLSGALPAAAADVIHTNWDHLLKMYVSGEGLVNYRGAQREAAVLEQYLAQLADVDPALLTTDRDRLAFWINAFNACVVRGVMDAYPVRSVREVKGFFNKRTYRIAGQDRTLEDMADEARRPGDWRVHFAMVRASTGGPPLRTEAYMPLVLHSQLDSQMRRFLSDPARGVRVEERAKTLRVTKLFKWYAGDFVSGGKLSTETLLPVLRQGVERSVAESIRDGALTLKTFEYDWTLNEQPVASGSTTGD